MPKRLPPKSPRLIPEREMDIRFSRSGGPGGQNVNKRDTKVTVTWSVDDTAILRADEKRVVRENHGMPEGQPMVLQFHCREQRSQGENRATCVQRLHDRLEELLKVPVARVGTRKSKGVRRRELDQKTREGKKKQARRRVDLE